MATNNGGSDLRKLMRRRRIAIALSVLFTLTLGMSVGSLLALLGYGVIGAGWIAIFLATVVISAIAVVPACLILVRANRELQERGVIDFYARRSRDQRKRGKHLRVLRVLIPAYVALLIASKLGLDAMGESEALPWAVVFLLIGASAFGLFVTWLAHRRYVADIAERSGE